MIDGRRLVELRKEHGFSQNDLAVRVGVTTQTIWAIESGKTKSPSLDVAVRIAEALGVPVEGLFAPEDSSDALKLPGATATATAPEEVTQ